MKCIASILCFTSWILFVQDVQASRLPEPGGSVHIALPAKMESAFKRAHTSIPLLAQATSEEKGRKWVLKTKRNPRTIKSALEDCLRIQHASRSWPAALLSTADIQVSSVSVQKNAVEVVFSQPVGPMSELLKGCVVEPLQEQFVGPFIPLGSDGIKLNEQSIVPAPLLKRVVLAKDGYGTELRIVDSAVGNYRRMMLAPYPDLIVLVQSEETLQADPLELFPKEAGGIDKLYSHLASDVLVLAHSAGRGTEFRGLLPPGIVPSRPMSTGNLAKEHTRLRFPVEIGLEQRVSLACDSKDALADGLCKRLGLVLRDKEIFPRVEEYGADADLRIKRWRSPSSDPGLAMLHLLVSFPQLAVGLEKGQWVVPLLHEDIASRLEAALALERHLMEKYRIIPLVSVDVVYDVHPALKGVRVREDGIPILWDAWWGGPAQ